MANRAAAWTISRELLELMLRRHHRETRGKEDFTDLRLLQVGRDGKGQMIVIVEILDAMTDDQVVKEQVDRIVREA